ncbi:DUF881 domain-containing protein [Salirhabdus sp. Marseille-P4669]|uniref:DUF881 domain-containing protein n=1 Tax=Salirhabdus sp. Marseille-P4669 TaxID=2042310 RepID=UPI000C7E67AE|nr:DUF881 domain-containing protein [Salirhabdus sp. Marseille-P4669]
MKVRGRHVIFSFILLITGFLVAFSYQITKEETKIVKVEDKQLEEDYFYRNQLNETIKENKDLMDELMKLQEEISDYEEQLAGQEVLVSDYIDEKRQLQMITGEIPVTGPGVVVSLNDAEYIPSDQNVNDFIVHDLHVHMVINELLSSGASAIAINGQRLLNDSFIQCIGPVISVDGVEHPAPFVISAIGDAGVLEASLMLENGVVEQLVYDHVEVKVEKQDKISMDARISSEGW